MAVFLRHGLFKTTTDFSTKNLVRCYAAKRKNPNYDKKVPPKIESSIEVLASRGFLRSCKAYNPPEDFRTKIQTICDKILGKNEESISDITKKSAVLTACAKELNHSVPNSLLHTMKTIQDVFRFYEAPVNTTIPLDMMRNVQLPENVHVQYEPHRFHPETDTMFNGVTAFPRSSTLVTGLKYRKKYQGHEARTTWPYNT